MGCGGPQGCETSRLPHFLDNRLTDGNEVVSLTCWPPFTPRNIPGTHSCQRLSQSQGYTAGMIRSTEKSNDLIGNRTCGFPACSIMPQPTTLLCAPDIDNRDTVWELSDQLIWTEVLITEWEDRLRHTAIKASSLQSLTYARFKVITGIENQSLAKSYMCFTGSCFLHLHSTITMTEASGSSETLSTIYQPTLCHLPEDSNIHHEYIL
jgi:hypothetical protein